MSEIIEKSSFGDDFIWGVASAAYQVEGAHNLDGKGLSVWDDFVKKKNKIHRNQNADVSCNFYELYKEDLRLMSAMNIKNNRFSLSWPRILPDGTGKINEKGLDFYDRAIDYGLELGIEPWLTLYHWDLPLKLQQKGGWTNRDIVHWFTDYVATCTKRYGDRVKNWMVLNEPMVFVGAGYFLGIHAPGEKRLHNFLPALHHAMLCQAEGARVVRTNLPDANIGTTFSCSHISAHNKTREKDYKAVKKIDALLNRLCLEPVLGRGYPWQDIPTLKRLEKYMLPGDEKLMPFDFDFIGVQNYTREVVKHSCFIPFVHAKIVGADKRNKERTEMNWEVYPKSIYKMLLKFSKYPEIKNLIVTENGSAFPDEVVNNRVPDVERRSYLHDYLDQVLRAKSEGVNVNGYFVWSFMDNFEWAEGYRPRFGLVHVDYQTQKRIIKDSGKWFAEFLKK